MNNVGFFLNYGDNSNVFVLKDHWVKREKPKKAAFFFNKKKIHGGYP